MIKINMMASSPSITSRLYNRARFFTAAHPNLKRTAGALAGGSFILAYTLGANDTTLVPALVTALGAGLGKLKKLSLPLALLAILCVGPVALPFFAAKWLFNAAMELILGRRTTAARPISLV